MTAVQGANGRAGERSPESGHRDGEMRYHVAAEEEQRVRLTYELGRICRIRDRIVRLGQAARSNPGGYPPDVHLFLGAAAEIFGICDADEFEPGWEITDA